MPATSGSQVSRRFSERESRAYGDLVAHLRASRVPDSDVLAQLQLFQPRVALAHTLFLDELYRRMLRVPGSIAEFGVQWGRNLAAFHSLRALYEPTNMSRHIYGFDTFAGFPSVSTFDGDDEATRVGGLAVAPGWEQDLEAILSAHEGLSLRPEHRRFNLVKGDVVDTLPKFIADHPHVLFSMIYLDLDLYEPTRDVLAAVWPRVPKGGLVVFDEINLDLFPGETLALLEGIDIGGHEICRSPFGVYQAYVVK